jgi:acyl-coenzyme A synthetase/AMP-(fatty) acid ligase/thioesterase domain-containing protein/acyl carrier protein
VASATCPTIALDDAPELATLSDERPSVDVRLDWPSHLLFTSGTTGKPKGVLALHANLVHYLQVARQRYGFRPDDVFAAAARMTFSISLFELLLPLCSGASVRPLERDDVLSGARLRDALDQVTVLHFGPSLLSGLFRHMRQHGGKLRPLERIRHASTGGDMVPPQVIEDCKRAFPNAELFVIYGCTEVSCMGCTYPIDRDVPMTRTMVGKAFPDMVARLLDAHGNPVAPGVVGEICFSGKGLVTGYVGQPELTATKFAPFEGERCYRTGDLGRLHTDGNIEILGRRDFQVQIRGIRIELAGIEHTIRAIGLAPQCAVIAKRVSDDERRLVAFVVDPKDPTPAGFRRALAEHLPDYMLPSAVVVLDALPLTANGKLDRAALEQMPLEGTAVRKPNDAGNRPTSALELAIAATFGKVLGIDAAGIGLDDNFFDLGGDSLQLVMLVTELSVNVGVAVDPGALFERATVRQIAELARKPDTFVPRPVLLSRDASKPSVYLLLGVQIYQELADRLGDEWAMQAVYSGKELRLLAEDDRGTSVTVQALAADYLRVIRAHQPHGPYRMIGLSFGGIVAYEVAQLLRASGEKVVFLGMIDSALPLSGAAMLRSLVGRSPVDVAKGAISRLREHIARRRGQPVKAPESAFVMPSDDERKVNFERRRQQAYRIASTAYMTGIRPLAQHVTLAVATRRLARDPWQSPTCGLEGFVASIENTPVDAEHAELLRAPAVDVIATAFGKALARTRS